MLKSREVRCGRMENRRRIFWLGVVVLDGNGVDFFL